MSQAGVLNMSASSAGAVITLTGDSGGAVSPDGSGNINVNGATIITTAGNPGAHSITISSALPSYTTGTWTPTVIGSATAGTTTYTIQNASYVQIGKLVFVTFDVEGSISGATGSWQFGGLPYSIGQVIGTGLLNSELTLDNGFTSYFLQNSNGEATTFFIIEYGSGKTTQLLGVTNASFAFNGTITYMTA